jgi:ketosteroid isomerase-like protein
MDDHARIEQAATEVAEAIGHKDVAALERLLAPDFQLRSPGGPSTERAAFIRAVCDIPAEVLSVTLTDVEIDLGDGTALVSGQQHARCRFHGEEVLEVRPFVDWFVRGDDGQWRIRVALDLAPQA